MLNYMLKNKLPVHCWIILILCCTLKMYSQEIDSTQNSTAVSTKEKGKESETGNEILGNLFFTPGDALKISLFPDTLGFPQGIYIIDDKGYVDFPIIGYKKVTDKTVETLESLLRTAYVNYLPQPNIQVRPLIRVNLMGGFYRPGLYWADPRESMWNLVQRAGGTEREDGIERLKWKRGSELVTNDCVTHFESGKSLQSIGFRSGDRIQVTQRPKQRGWDVFRADIIPMLTVTLSTMTTAFTAYMAYQAYKERP